MAARPAPPVLIALLAGGRGTRFWPLSRHALPKQFLDVAGDGPLLKVTRDRVAELCQPGDLFVVTTKDQAARARSVLKLPASHVLGEPAGRNTAPAVGVAALLAAERDEDAVLLALPADHHVRHPARLRAVLRRGIKAARSLRTVVLFGAVPDRPETGYGYLTLGAATAVPGVTGLRRVARFREKPDLAGAKRLVKDGALWNSGMFCLHARGLLDEINRVLPTLGAGLSELAPHVGRPGFARAFAAIHPRLPAVSFDHGVLEHARSVHALPVDVGWSDVGSWESLWELARRDARGNGQRGDVLFHDADGCLAISEPGRSGSARTLVVLGARDLVLVDTGDVVFACPKGEVRDVKRLLERIAKERPRLS